MQNNLSNLKLHVQSMDRRFAASECFRYRVRVTPNTRQIYVPDVDRIIAFNQFRQWCIDSLGMSCERDPYVKLYYEHTRLGRTDVDINPDWAWFYQENKMPYFYFTERGMSWVQIKWL